MSGDLEDLESALNKSSLTRPLGSGSCSALIKMLPNNKDLLVSHDTWGTYQSMLRIIKKYSFAFKVSPLGIFMTPVLYFLFTHSMYKSYQYSCFFKGEKKPTLLPTLWNVLMIMCFIFRVTIIFINFVPRQSDPPRTDPGILLLPWFHFFWRWLLYP